MKLKREYNKLSKVAQTVWGITGILTILLFFVAYVKIVKSGAVLGLSVELILGIVVEYGVYIAVLLIIAQFSAAVLHHLRRMEIIALDGPGVFESLKPPTQPTESWYTEVKTGAGE